jgi:glutamate-5-semialdehyde dehydrogenase
MSDLAKKIDVQSLMRDMGRAAKAAAKSLAIATAERKFAALAGMAQAISAHTETILVANALDMALAHDGKLSPALLDRLQLDKNRVRGIIDSIRSIAEIKDPIGEIIAEWDRPNGLHIERVRTPLGVIGVIYESRPNVTADAGALCLKSGNAVILRGGSDCVHTSAALHRCLVEGLVNAGLPTECIQLVPVNDRAAVGEMLKGLDGAIDVIVPRGGRSLVVRVQAEARVPVFAHLEGLCHVYVDKSADLEMARKIVVNSKLRRTGICGSAETLLIDRAVAATHLIPILEDLAGKGCEIRGDRDVVHAFPAAKPATDADWSTEYLDAIISVRLVSGVSEAIEHIQHWSSNHTEAVIAEDPRVVSRFFNEIDSAILLHNASTQFADGGEFGMGAEIGIATGKMHARGPVGVEQLTSFKYRVRGTGQTRP